MPPSVASAPGSTGKHQAVPAGCPFERERVDAGLHDGEEVGGAQLDDRVHPRDVEADAARRPGSRGPRATSPRRTGSRGRGPRPRWRSTAETSAVVWGRTTTSGRRGWWNEKSAAWRSRSESPSRTRSRSPPTASTSAALSTSSITAASSQEAASSRCGGVRKPRTALRTRSGGEGRHRRAARGLPRVSHRVPRSARAATREMLSRRGR